MSFFVGAVLGGPEGRSSPVLAAIQLVSRLSDQVRDQASEEPAIDLVFHVPGSLLKPPYQGLRTGRFSKKEKILMVQVSVPEGQVFASDPLPFILAAMRQSIDLAGPVFAKGKIPFSPEDHLRAVAVIEAGAR